MHLLQTKVLLGLVWIFALANSFSFINYKELIINRIRSEIGKATDKFRQSTGINKTLPVALEWDTNRYKRSLYNSNDRPTCECGPVNNPPPNNLTDEVRDYFFLVFTKSEQDNGVTTCGATLIASNLLVTSNKCFIYENKSIYPYDTWKSVKGQRNTVSANDIIVVHIENKGNYTVKEVILNPGFAAVPKDENDFSEEDIALLVLEKNLFEEGYYSVCLPNSETTVQPSDVFYRSGVYVGGGGIVRIDKTPEIRMAPSVVTLNANDCDKEIKPEFMSGNDTICLRSRYPIPLREGGSLVISDANKRQFLVGVGTNVGYQLEATNVNYAYFTNVLHLTRFIERHANASGSTWCTAPEIDLTMPQETDTEVKLHPWEGNDFTPEPRDTSLDCVCGIKNTGVQLTRISGGEESIPYEFPWMVKLAAQSADGLAYSQCGASIINDRMIITAGHCVVFPKSLKATEEDVAKPENIAAYVSAHLLYDEDPRQRIAEVTQVILHPDYSFGVEAITEDTDVALLILKEPLEFPPGVIQLESGVRPVCLPKHGIPIELANKIAEQSGWGKNDINLPPGFEPPGLQKISLPILPLEECIAHAAGIITGNMICAGYLKETKSPLEGDSGGPLSIEDGDEKLWTQIGVVSFGAPEHDAQQLPNGTIDWGAFPTFFVNLQKFTSFIDYHAHQVGAKWCKMSKA